MKKLYGAILGDLAGQPYEYKYEGDFSEFNIHDERSVVTDDTILTLATAAYMLGRYESFEDAYRQLGQKYYHLNCFGKGFKEWLSTPYGTVNNSWGNGCLMRVSPCMMVNNIPKSLELSIASCMTSHAHYESVMALIKLNHLYFKEARYRRSCYPFRDKREYIKSGFFVDAKTTISIVENIYLSTDRYVINAIEETVKIGGDTDTNASIVGELMNHTFKTLKPIDMDYVESKLDSFLLDILYAFNKKFQ